MRSRHRRSFLSLGLLMAVLPAVAAAALTLQHLGAGRRGSGLGMAAFVGLLVLFAIGLPIDLALDALRRRRDRGRPGAERRTPHR